MISAIQEFKGKKVFVIKDETKNRIIVAFGYRKAVQIVKFFNEIQKFVIEESKIERGR